MAQAHEASESLVEHASPTNSTGPPSPLSPGRFALSLLLTLVISGVSMALLFNPEDPRQAQELLSSLSQASSFFRYSRLVHRWSAFLLILFVLVHWLGTWRTKFIRVQRQLNWSLGLTLLLSLLLLVNSGYLLRWDVKALALVQFTVAQRSGVGALGQKLVTLVLDRSSAGLIQFRRAHIIHTVILPLLTVAGLFFHIRFSTSHQPHTASAPRANGKYALAPLGLSLLLLLLLIRLPLSSDMVTATSRTIWPHPDWLWLIGLLPAWVAVDEMFWLIAGLLALVVIGGYFLVPSFIRRSSIRPTAALLFGVGALLVLAYSGKTVKLASQIPYQGCNVCHQSGMIGQAPTLLVEVLDARDPTWLKFHLRDPVISILTPAD